MFLKKSKYWNISTPTALVFKLIHCSCFASISVLQEAYSLWNWRLTQFQVWTGLNVTYPECQMSTSSLRWPQICTTCWSTMDTSWTVEVWSRWRGKERWPLTSSPVAPRAVNDSPAGRRMTPAALIRQRLQRDWVVSSAMSAEARCKHTGDKRRSTETESVCCHVLRCTHVGRSSLKAFFPQAAREIMKPSCLRSEVAMLVFMSNSASISSGVIYFHEKQNNVL